MVLKGLAPCCQRFVGLTWSVQQQQQTRGQGLTCWWRLSLAVDLLVDGHVVLANGLCEIYSSCYGKVGNEVH